MNYLDIGILLLLILGAVRGYRRGLLNALTGLVGIVFGAVIASSWARPTAEYVDARYSLTNKMSVWLLDKLPNLVSLESSKDDGLLAGMFQALTEKIMADSAVVSNVGVLYNISFTLLVILAFLVMMFIVTLLLRIVAVLITRIIKHSVFGGVNRLGGLIIGVGTATVVIGLILMVISPFVTVGASVGADGIFGSIGLLINTSVLAPEIAGVFQLLLNQFFF